LLRNYARTQPCGTARPAALIALLFPTGCNPGCKVSATGGNCDQLHGALRGEIPPEATRSFRPGAGRSQVQILSPRSCERPATARNPRGSRRAAAAATGGRRGSRPAVPDPAGGGRRDRCDPGPHGRPGRARAGASTRDSRRGHHRTTTVRVARSPLEAPSWLENGRSGGAVTAPIAARDFAALDGAHDDHHFP